MPCVVMLVAPRIHLQQLLFWITVAAVVFWPLVADRDGKEREYRKIITRISSIGSLARHRAMLAECDKCTSDCKRICEECWGKGCCEPSFCQTRKIGGSDYVIVVDTSTSVGHMCGPLANLVLQLRSEILLSGNEVDHFNRVAVVKFSTHTKIIHRLICKDQSLQAHSRDIRNMQCNGITNVHGAFSAAKGLLEKQENEICRAKHKPRPDRNKHIIFLSDGEPSDKDQAESLALTLRDINKFRIISLYLKIGISDSNARTFMQHISNKYSEVKFDTNSIIDDIVGIIMEQRADVDKCQGCTPSVCFPPPPPPPPPRKQPCAKVFKDCPGKCRGADNFSKSIPHENQANIFCYPDSTQPTCSCERCCQTVPRTCDEFFVNNKCAEGLPQPILDPRSILWNGDKQYGEKNCCMAPLKCEDLLGIIDNAEAMCSSHSKIWQSETMSGTIIQVLISNDIEKQKKVFVDACCVHLSCIDFGFVSKESCGDYFIRPPNELRSIRRKNIKEDLTEEECCFGKKCDEINCTKPVPHIPDAPPWFQNNEVRICDTRVCGSNTQDACCKKQCCVRAKTCLDFALNFKCPPKLQLRYTNSADLEAILCGNNGWALAAMGKHEIDVCSEKDAGKCCIARPDCNQFWEMFGEACVDSVKSAGEGEIQYEKERKNSDHFCRGRTCSIEDKATCCRKVAFCSEWRAIKTNQRKSGCYPSLTGPDTTVVVAPSMEAMIDRFDDERLEEGLLDNEVRKYSWEGIPGSRSLFDKLLRIRQLCCDPTPTCADPQYVDMCKVPGLVRKDSRELEIAKVVHANALVVEPAAIWTYQGPDGTTLRFPRHCNGILDILAGARECNIQSCCERTCEIFPCVLPKYRKPCILPEYRAIDNQICDVGAANDKPVWKPCPGSCTEDHCCTSHTCATTDHVCLQSKGKVPDPVKFLSNEPCQAVLVDPGKRTDDECCTKLECCQPLQACSDKECCKELPTCVSELTHDFCKGDLTSDSESSYKNKPDFDSIICKTMILGAADTILGYKCSIDECCDFQSTCAKSKKGEDAPIDCSSGRNGGGRCPPPPERESSHIDYSRDPQCFITKPGFEKIVCQVGGDCTAEKHWEMCCDELASCRDAGWICSESRMYLKPDAAYLFCGQDGCNMDDRDLCCLPPPTCTSPVIFPCSNFKVPGSELDRFLRAEADFIECDVGWGFTQIADVYPTLLSSYKSSRPLVMENVNFPSPIQKTFVDYQDAITKIFAKYSNNETLVSNANAFGDDYTLAWRILSEQLQNVPSCSENQLVSGEALRKYVEKPNFGSDSEDHMYTFQNPFLRYPGRFTELMNLNEFLCCGEPTTCKSILKEAKHEYCTLPRWVPKPNRQNIVLLQDAEILLQCCDPRPTCKTWIDEGCNQPALPCPASYTKENGGAIPVEFSIEDDAYCPTAPTPLPAPYWWFGDGYCSDDEERGHRIKAPHSASNGWVYNEAQSDAEAACNKIPNCAGYHWNVRDMSYVLVDKIGPTLGRNTEKDEKCFHKAVSDVQYLLVGNGLCSPTEPEEVPTRIGVWVNGSRSLAETRCNEDPSCRGFHWQEASNSYVLVSKVSPVAEVKDGEQCYQKASLCTEEYCYNYQPPLCVDYSCGARLKDTSDAYYLVSKQDPEPCRESVHRASDWRPLVRCTDAHCCLPVTCGSQYEYDDTMSLSATATEFDCTKHTEPDPGFFPNKLQACPNPEGHPCLKKMVKSNRISNVWKNIPCAGPQCKVNECCKAPDKIKFAPWFQGHHYSGGMNGGSEEFRARIGTSLHITTLAMTPVKKAEAYGITVSKYNELVRQGEIWDPDRSPRHTMPDWMLDFFLQVGHTGHRRGDAKDKDCEGCDKFELLARWYYIRENGRQKKGRMTQSEICSYLQPPTGCEHMFTDVRDEKARESLESALNQKIDDTSKKETKDGLKRLAENERQKNQVVKALRHGGHGGHGLDLDGAARSLKLKKLKEAEQRPGRRQHRHGQRHYAGRSHAGASRSHGGPSVVGEADLSVVGSTIAGGRRA